MRHVLVDDGVGLAEIDDFHVFPFSVAAKNNLVFSFPVTMFPCDAAGGMPDRIVLAKVRKIRQFLSSGHIKHG